MKLALSNDEIATFEARTEGWITGLQLVSLALQGNPQLTQQQTLVAVSMHNQHQHQSQKCLYQPPTQVGI
jgi:ATP/maltotriose-dependent transcriptional regulator MalT